MVWIRRRSELLIRRVIAQVLIALLCVLPADAGQLVKLLGLQRSISASYLVVGGGAGGGGGQWNGGGAAGGGGGGGDVQSGSVNLVATTYAIVVGTGGGAGG